jgi:hypothetical protein
MTTFNLAIKSIKNYNTHSFSIKRFAVLFQKLNLYIIGLCLLIPAIWFNIFDEDFIHKRDIAFNYNTYLKEQYSKWSNEYRELESLNIDPGTPLKSFQDYSELQSKGYFTRYGFIFGTIIITALPWLLILFWPAGAPIRVDRKNGLVYTRQWFRFYAARFDQIQPECKNFSAALERVGGPLIISLYRPGKVYDKNGNLNRGMRIRIGCYPPPDLSHNRDVLRCIKKFMNHEADIPKGLKPKKGWLEWSLVPSHKLPKQTKLDKLIKYWINKEQDK